MKGGTSTLPQIGTTLQNTIKIWTMGEDMMFIKNYIFLMHIPRTYACE